MPGILPFIPGPPNSLLIIHTELDSYITNSKYSITIGELSKNKNKTKKQTKKP